MNALVILSAILTLVGAQRTDRRDGSIYVWVEAGTFAMGCSPGDEQCFVWEDPSHRVSVQRGFWIGQTEVTQRAYQRVTRASPSLYKGEDRPVDRVSWNDARHYCAAIGMRLPTEMEWEYAARGGSPAPLYGPLDSVAWYDANSGDSTHDAARKTPNAYGLFDMIGNVWEWVSNSYSDAGHKNMRVLRGGSFVNPARELRVSNRLWAAPETAHRNMGFRCVANY